MALARDDISRRRRLYLLNSDSSPGLSQAAIASGLQSDRAMPLTRDEDLYELLATTRTIAMIGASDRPDRPSYGVMRFLQDWGYRVLPVNPQITGEHVHGEYVWRELAQI